MYAGFIKMPPAAHLVILPGMSVSVHLDHVLILGAKASAEDWIGNVPVNVNRFETPTL